MVVLLFLLATANPHSEPVHRFDVIESNEFNVAQNTKNNTTPPRQRLYWRDGNIVCWRMEHGQRGGGLIFRSGRCCEVIEENGRVYFIEAREYRETWYWGDVERDEIGFKGTRWRREPSQW